MKLSRSLAVFLVLIGLLTAGAVAADDFTPVIAAPLEPQAKPVAGTDGKYHLVYELQLTNTKEVLATIEQIDVLLDAADPKLVIASYTGTDLIKRLRTLAPRPATDAKLAPNTVRLFYIELAFDNAAHIPKGLKHRLHLTGAASWP